MGGGLSVGEAPVRVEGGEIEEAREHVLPLRDPRDRLRLDGVEREDRRREPRPRDAEPPEQQPEEHRAGRVQQDVGDVESEGVEAPEVILEPEGREDQGIILGKRRGLEPDASQAFQIPQRRVPCDVRIVVPDEAALERGYVGDERHHDDQGRPERRLLPARPRGGAVRHPSRARF